MPSPGGYDEAGIKGVCIASGGKAMESRIYTFKSRLFHALYTARAAVAITLIPPLNPTVVV